ncbi:hypothetical protein [Agromyces sp. NPDC058104]|uniref:hypothetical protein n=1 Tax=Agromyces sp. NPDC058104 TaxID=3346342 RepID=UPI0036DB637E
MGRRRAAPIPHREFFRAVTLEETVALACTCSRGADHWYGEPQRTTGRASSGLAAPATDALGADEDETVVDRSQAC